MKGPGFVLPWAEFPMRYIPQQLSPAHQLAGIMVFDARCFEDRHHKNAMWIVMGYSASGETALELQETEPGLRSLGKELYLLQLQMPCVLPAHLQFLSFVYYLSFIYSSV